MIIHSISVKNFKSFRDSNTLEFTPGFNVIVGPNNSGKTALIEALSLRFENKPHVSEEAIPHAGTPPSGQSRVQCTLRIDNSEFRRLMWPQHRTFHIRRDSSSPATEQAQKVISAFKSAEFDIVLEFEPQKLNRAYIKGIDSGQRSNDALRFQLDSESAEPKLNHENVQAGEEGLAAFKVAQELIKWIYLFRAERFNVGQHEVGTGTTVLRPNAYNLAQVLHALQTANPARYRRLTQLTHTIFPDVKQITVPPMQNLANTVRITLWSIDPTTERQDLALPLQESGTGVGQVLAILYVAITSDNPQVILIDEPQSFLHPGAIRKLFDILRQDFSRHQYIVTTHSPIVVSAARPGSLILLRKPAQSTQVERIDSGKAADMHLMLASVGSRLADVFGADNIIWVEGRTEEISYPLIVERLLHRPLLGTRIIGVLDVGELQGRHSATILRIYNRLSKGSALLPPAIGFIFDREERSEQDIDDLVRESKGTIHFLPRRMFENYLLNAEAIAAMMGELEDFPAEDVTEKQVGEWIDTHRWDPDLYPDEQGAVEENQSEIWQSRVNGAKLLAELFRDLSEGRYEFNKVSHCLILTNWLLDHSPEDLQDVADLISKILGPDDAGVIEPIKDIVDNKF